MKNKDLSIKYKSQGSTHWEGNICTDLKAVRIQTCDERAFQPNESVTTKTRVRAFLVLFDQLANRDEARKRMVREEVRKIGLSLWIRASEAIQ